MNYGRVQCGVIFSRRVPLLLLVDHCLRRRRRPPPPQQQHHQAPPPATPPTRGRLLRARHLDLGAHLRRGAQPPPALASRPSDPALPSSPRRSPRLPSTPFPPFSPPARPADEAPAADDTRSGGGSAASSSRPYPPPLQPRRPTTPTASMTWPRGRPRPGPRAAGPPHRLPRADDGTLLLYDGNDFAFLTTVHTFPNH